MCEGQKVLWLDFDSDPQETIKRLQLMGATASMVRQLFDYRQPDVSPKGDSLAYEAIYQNQYGFAVIDGVTDAMSLFSMSIGDNDDFSRLARVMLRPLANNGAAVVLVDHVTKSEDGRGRFAIGAQSKMSVLTGASYVVDMTELVAPGRTGQIRLRVGKDRPGYVRTRSATWRGKDRLQEAARITVQSDDHGIRMDVQAPALDPFDDAEGSAANHRDTGAQIVDWLREEGATTAQHTRSVRQIREGVGARRDQVAEAVRDLTEKGSLTVINVGGPRGQQVYLSETKS